MNKQREFWIKDFIVFKTHDKYSDGASVREAYDKPAPNRQIHVVEYSALQEALDKLNYLQNAIQNFNERRDMERRDME